MHSFKELHHQIESALEQETFNGIPQELYDSINYVVNLGGKRLRPVLCLMGCELFDGDLNKAMKPATGLELFHNFTLVHDDLMDQADLRRGKYTVHKKWDPERAILAGDLLHVISNQYMMVVDDDLLREVLELYHDSAIKVCEGQQLDMDFENSVQVDLNDYMQMIELKTATLFAASLNMGAVLAKTNDQNKKHIYEFGRNMGLAFQIQDDYLDTFGNSDKFGKTIGGDIVANKKTYPLLKAYQMAEQKEHETLTQLMNDDQMADKAKISQVKASFMELGVKESTEHTRDEYYKQAQANLAEIQVEDAKKEPLMDLCEYIMKRES